jgi:hypothetical protein
MVVRDAVAEVVIAPRASLERAVREEAAANVEEDVVREEMRAKEEKAERREKASKAKEESAAEAVAEAVAAMAVRAETDHPDNIKAMKSVRKGLPEEKDSRAALRVRDKKAAFSVGREAAAEASVEVAVPREAMN